MNTLLLLTLLAQAPAPPRLNPTQPAPRRVGVDIAQRDLTLAQAIEMALKNNLEIEVEKTNRAAAGEAVRAARGYWDPAFRWLPSLERRNTPTGSVLQGAGGVLAEHLHSQNFAFRQRLPWEGAQLNVDFDNSRQASTNPFVSLNPFVTSRLLVSVTQPLLRNRLIDRERAELKIRRKNQDLSALDFELRTIDVITRVEQTYWDLVAARQDVSVKADAVEWAREQLARNRRMIDAGALAPVELSASEAELERRLDTWYASIGVVTEVENALKTLLAPDRAAALWSEEIVPVDERLAGPAGIYDLRENVNQAVAARPELRLIQARQQVNEIERRQNVEQVKPQVNLVASWSSAGLAGSTRPGDNPFSASQAALYERLNQLSAKAGLPPLSAAGFGSLPDRLVGGYGATLSNLFSGGYQTAQVGLSFDFNLRNNTAEANLAQTALAARRLKIQQAQLEQAIEAQVRNALQAIQTARQRQAAAQAGARAAKDKLDSETRLFQTGESTNFLVLTRQNEYADSRRREVVANLDYNKAVSRLAQAMGSTLRDHKVSVQ
ncbi:MAG: TolC family protein [Candidatus Solibacter usitatus]|nr:TolC family protein [Candidatus Solibacter usitatus]